MADGVVTIDLFQSTHPMRDATHAGCFSQHGQEFQSTHPMRDATFRIADHAVGPLFQSTHPMRDATLWIPAKYVTVTISIHASHAGCDLRCFSSRYEAAFISIHASHAGCDRAIVNAVNELCNFNPRIPCGMRLTLLSGLPTQWTFQSTHPMRDATKYVTLEGVMQAIFQSTHPMRDATSFRPSMPLTA